MLRHNWKCTHQSDLVYLYVFIVMFNCYASHICEAESMNTNSLTRLWKMSESRNRLSDISNAINKTNSNILKSALRSFDSDFIPSFPHQTIRRFEEEHSILPLFSKLSTTYRPSSSIKDYNVKMLSPSTSSLKTYERSNESTLNSVNTPSFTTSKPYKSPSDSYGKSQTPTTYKPSIQLNFQTSKSSSKKEFGDKSWNNSESDSVTRRNTATQGFTPRMIPVNIDEYSISDEPAITLDSYPFTTTFKPNFLMTNKPNESSPKRMLKTQNHFDEGKYNATYLNRTFIPSVTFASYRDQGPSVTGRQLSEESTQENYSIRSLEQDVDENFPTDIDGGRKSSINKKYKKFMLPLLLAYKLKFVALLPLLMGGLVLLAGSTGMAGFFFALFAAVMGLKTNGDHH